jgi:hypothetical protein
MGGLETVEEIGLNVFNRLHRYWLGRFGMIRAGQVRNWATIWATSYGEIGRKTYNLDSPRCVANTQLPFNVDGVRVGRFCVTPATNFFATTLNQL